MAEENPGGAPVAAQQIMCAAILMMPITYMAGAIALRASDILPEGGLGELDEQSTLLLTAVFLAASVSASIFSLFLKKMLLGAAKGDRIDQSMRFKAVLVAMALSESGAVMGLVLMLLTGNLLYGALLCGLSFAITCFHFPRRHWLEHGDDAL